MIRGVYSHTKTGNEYFVKGTVIDKTNERDGEILVLYHPNGDEEKLCVRELNEFFAKFKFERKY